MMTCLTSAFNVDDVDIEEVIAEVTSVVGERPQLVTTRPGQPWVGLTTDCAIHIAHDDRTRNRIREEAERLAWAARNGIPVPAVVDQREEWLVTSRAVNDGVTSGRPYVEAAIGAARAIAAASEPPPSLRAPVAAHGGGRWAGLVRLSPDRPQPPLARGVPGGAGGGRPGCPGTRWPTATTSSTTSSSTPRRPPSRSSTGST